MQIPLSLVKILETEFEKVISSEEWCSILLEGNLYEFEKQLHSAFHSLYNKVVEQLISFVSTTSEFESLQRQKAEELGLKNLVFRTATLQLRTGMKVKYESLYAKRVPLGYDQSRHLSSLLWSSGMSCSPMHKSLSCLFSVLCPSFDVAKSLLNYQDISVNTDRVRQVSLSLAEDCIQSRTTIQLEQGETLADKKVVIAMDGGRTRTRVYDPEKVGRAEKFETPWREPKMFVITTCEEEAKVNKACKPIYDSTFGDDEVFELLEGYLKNLEIEKAASVQFIADGAPWIWNRVKPLLLKLGVEESKIIETLDYFHAMEHLNEMLVYFEKEEQASYLKKLKNVLWKGDFKKMTNLVKKGISDVVLEDFNPLNYFRKQQNRIDYESLKAAERPCGSGVIESAIRRIINLRFKAPSSFWYPENAEKLIFMRGVALSGRWEIMMKNQF